MYQKQETIHQRVTTQNAESCHNNTMAPSTSNSKWDAFLSRLHKKRYSVATLGCILFVGLYIYLQWSMIQFLIGWDFKLPIVCANCFEHDDYKYVINNKDVCTGDVYLLVVVASVHMDISARHTIRKTWGSKRRINGKNIRTVFHFGTHEIQSYNAIVYNEAKIEKDIIVSSFKENFENMTVHSVMGIKWATQHCPQAKYIIKADDETFLNIPNIVEQLENLNQPKDLIGGRCLKQNRDEITSKYNPGRSFHQRDYPQYCQGPAYFMSQDVAGDIITIASSIPVIPLEDVYITGLCRAIIQTKPIDVKGFIIPEEKKTLAKCDKIDSLSIPDVGIEEMKELWALVGDGQAVTECHTNWTPVQISGVILLAILITAFIMVKYRKAFSTY
ncbi:unnamed protein product [Owenia fusiformis]|uniref:Hexosyltransferase n=1 Tax=Owenia fusiformis TaxID=6347 RepID=A0A8S4PGU3_OWEFU|nr:unnamed protein product [Owenia fusiformis]